MSEIGVFTPEQARLVWQDYLSRQQLAPPIRENFPQRRQIDEPSPHRVFIQNASGETMPAFGCGQITGTTTSGGVTVVTVTKPTTTDGEYLINSQFEIATGGNGWAYRFGTVIFTGTAASGIAEFRPVVSSWNIAEGPGPFVIFGAHNVVSNGLIGRIRGGGDQLFGFNLTADMAANSGAADIEQLNGASTPSFLEESTVYDPYGIFASLVNGANGLCVLRNGKYYIIQAACPA